MEEKKDWNLSWIQNTAPEEEEPAKVGLFEKMVSSFLPKKQTTATSQKATETSSKINWKDRIK